MEVLLTYFVFIIGFATTSNSLKFDLKYISIDSSKHNEMSWNRIEKCLSKPLRYIPHLHVMLRANDYLRNVENTYTQWFLQQTKVPIVLNTYEDILNYSTDSLRSSDRDNYVIATSMPYFRMAARYFSQRSGIYFFVINDKVDMMEVREICHKMWQNFQIYKNFLLTHDGVFIYDPFASNALGEYGQIREYQGEQSLERTLFQDMRGYPLRVQMFRSVYSKPQLDPITKKVNFVYGVDGRVAELLQKRLNFTMNLLDPDPDYFGERFANGSYNGAIGSIINNELDLCLSGFFVKDYMVPEMEFSVAVYDDELCIYTPKAKRIPESILPIFSVRYDLWLGFILTGFVCSVIWAVLRGINLRLKFPRLGHLDMSYKWQYVRILIDTWVVWVRVNLVHYPPFHSERIFVATLCLVSVIFGAIFESSLATVYIHPMYYKDIHTMQELDESGLYVIYKYTSMADDLFFSETSPLFANLNKKLKHLKDLNFDVLKDVAEKGGKASVTRLTTLNLEYLEYIVSKEVWIIPECPKYYTISYVWPKDAPWDETINQLLLRMLNAGLIKKFIADMQTDVDIGIIKKRQFNHGSKFKILTIEDLQLAFYVVLVGSLMAFLSVAVERRKKSKPITHKYRK